MSDNFVECIHAFRPVTSLKESGTDKSVPDEALINKSTMKLMKPISI